MTRKEEVKEIVEELEKMAKDWKRKKEAEKKKVRSISSEEDTYFPGKGPFGELEE